MIWQIKAYNGTTWLANKTMQPEEAIESFLKDTGLTRWDIKSIINLH